SGVPELDHHALERQRLALGIEAKRHCRAGAESCEQEIVGARTAVEAADLDGLIGEKPVPADRDLLLESSLPGFANDDGLRIVRRCSGGLLRVEIALGPRADDVGDVSGVAAAAYEVIGV